MQRRVPILIAGVVGLGAATIVLVRAHNLRPSSGENLSYAVGARTKVVAPYPCSVISQTPELTAEMWEGSDGWGSQFLHLHARQAGRVMVACQDGAHVFTFVPAARIDLQGPVSLANREEGTVTAHARSADGGALEVGDLFGDAISFEGTLGAVGGHCEFPPWCGTPPEGSVYVEGGKLGAGAVTISLPGTKARWSVESVMADGGVPSAP